MYTEVRIAWKEVKFCEFLREKAIKIINFEETPMKLLTEELQLSYENAKIIFVKENLKINIWKKDKMSLCRGI